MVGEYKPVGFSDLECTCIYMYIYSSIDNAIYYYVQESINNITFYASAVHKNTTDVLRPFFYQLHLVSSITKLLPDPHLTILSKDYQVYHINISTSIK